MSSDRESVTQPLLPSSPSTRNANPNISSSSSPSSASPFSGIESSATPVTMVRQENMSRHAVGVQVSALLFVAVAWSTVLSTMSLGSLPLFGYHPLVQSLGILLLLQAVVVLQRTTGQQPVEKRAALDAHQWINIGLVLPLLTVGASIMWYLHDQPNSAHFISYHGILGTACVVVAWIQAALGAASVWWKGKLVGGENKGKALWKYHRLSGYVLVTLFLITAALGVVETTWGAKNSSWLQKALVVIALGLAGFALLIRVQRSKLPKL